MEWWQCTVISSSELRYATPTSHHNVPLLAKWEIIQRTESYKRTSSSKGIFQFRTSKCTFQWTVQLCNCTTVEWRHRFHTLHNISLISEAKWRHRFHTLYNISLISEAKWRHRFHTLHNISLISEAKWRHRFHTLHNVSLISEAHCKDACSSLSLRSANENYYFSYPTTPSLSLFSANENYYFSYPTTPLNTVILRSVVLGLLCAIRKKEFDLMTSNCS